MEIVVLEPYNVTLDKWHCAAILQEKVACTPECDPDLLRRCMAMRWVLGTWSNAHPSDGHSLGP